MVGVKVKMTLTRVVCRLAPGEIKILTKQAEKSANKKKYSDDREYGSDEDKQEGRCV